MADDNTPAQEGDGDEPFVLEAKERLRPFLELNPGMKLTGFSSDEDQVILAFHPWKDSSVALMLPKSENSFFEQLNKLYFPPRFRAIYHTDLKMLEVIWTAWKLDDEQEEIRGRAFNFDSRDEHISVFLEQLAIGC